MSNQPARVVPGLPATHRCWVLTGAGLENLALVEQPLPRPGAGELLVRIDACGICFSDIKILNLGGNHPRLQGRDLRSEPVVMGHETAMTVVGVGSQLVGRFELGQRFLIQADVYFKGEGMAFGYRLPGGYSQYQVIGPEILDGDEGCYLLPVSDRVSHAQAALCEPWACVEASYRYRPRPETSRHGRVLVVAGSEQSWREWSAQHPGVTDPVVLTPSAHPWLVNPAELDAGMAALRAAEPGGVDDILCLDGVSAATAGSLSTLLRPGGVFAMRGEVGAGRARIDVGAVHYRNHWYTGAPAGEDPYAWSRGTELNTGGTAWFIGAGGPLGQMHLQLALTLDRPPAKIIVTQNGSPRLEEIRRRFSGPAAARNVQLVLLDSLKLGEGVYDAVRTEAPDGCDDIIVVIPNAEVVGRAFDLLAPGGGLNLFAGVAVGTKAALEMRRFAADRVRIWGTSGSSIADLRRILEKVEAGTLATDAVVAAVGGIEAVGRGLEAVRDGTLRGKIVIYPHRSDLPLQTLTELLQGHPELADHLGPDQTWAPGAERMLLEDSASSPARLHASG